MEVDKTGEKLMHCPKCGSVNVGPKQIHADYERRDPATNLPSPEGVSDREGCNACGAVWLTGLVREAMKIDIPKDWCINMAKPEDGGEIGAGPLARDLVPDDWVCPVCGYCWPEDCVQCAESQRQIAAGIDVLQKR